ncbi:MAG: hypothetical protein K0V04_31575 [Deltaproteobacteria bacterium]|nr:hypothetical protein [Deltaproteobacteria bacterium]
MNRRCIDSGVPCERELGYRRAIVAGDHVHVTSTVALDSAAVRSSLAIG